MALTSTRPIRTTIDGWLDAPGRSRSPDSSFAGTTALDVWTT
jgi:hypothetical protein